MARRKAQRKLPPLKIPFFEARHYPSKTWGGVHIRDRNPDQRERPAVRYQNPQWDTRTWDDIYNGG